MKKLFFMALVAIVYSVGAYAQDYGTYLSQAKEKFAAGEYENAMTLFKKYEIMSEDTSQTELKNMFAICLDLIKKADAEYAANGYSDKAKILYEGVLEYNPEDARVKRMLTDWPVPVSGATYVETADGILSMKMIYVEGGTFTMGAPDVIKDDYLNKALRDAHPKHSVTLDSYYIGETEVTQQQWNAVMSSRVADIAIAENRPQKAIGDNIPMYYITWEQAVEFCNRLSQITGKKYQLPTEAQWEFAARGGVKSAGNDYSGTKNLEGCGWYENNGSKQVHPVAELSANELGIYDMSGNVHEWCNDWYKAEYQPEPQTNPTGAAWGEHRVYRGGDYSDKEARCRVYHRLHDPQDEVSSSRTVGFRVVCVVE